MDNDTLTIRAQDLTQAQRRAIRFGHAYRETGKQAALLPVVIPPLSEPHLITLTLNGGGNLDAPGLNGAVGIWAIIDQEKAGLLAEDICFCTNAHRVTYRASCSAQFVLEAGPERHGRMMVHPYGSQAEGNLDQIFARGTMSLIPIG